MPHATGESNEEFMIKASIVDPKLKKKEEEKSHEAEQKHVESQEDPLDVEDNVLNYKAPQAPKEVSSQVVDELSDEIPIMEEPK